MHKLYTAFGPFWPGLWVLLLLGLYFILFRCIFVACQLQLQLCVCVCLRHATFMTSTVSQTERESERGGECAGQLAGPL